MKMGLNDPASRDSESRFSRSWSENLLLIIVAAIVLGINAGGERRAVVMDLPKIPSQWEIPCRPASAKASTSALAAVSEALFHPLIHYSSTIDGIPLTIEQFVPFGEKIDLNAAGPDMLTLFSGIGKSAALAIIDYREEHQGFQHPSELLRVPGIGPSMYLRISPYLTIGPFRGKNSTKKAGVGDERKP
jgi:competence ComEA-like helix-hairpin-helix protein